MQQQRRLEKQQVAEKLHASRPEPDLKAFDAGRLRRRRQRLRLRRAALQRHMRQVAQRR